MKIPTYEELKEMKLVSASDFHIKACDNDGLCLPTATILPAPIASSFSRTNEGVATGPANELENDTNGANNRQSTPPAAEVSGSNDGGRQSRGR